MSEVNPTEIAFQMARKELQEAMELCRDPKSGLTDQEKFDLRHKKAMAVVKAGKAEINSLREESIAKIKEEKS